MKKLKFFATVILLAGITVDLPAQTDRFELGKYLEIQSMALRTLEDQYVDTLQLHKLLEYSIADMLSRIDPYTMMIPEENEEDLEMLTTGTYGGVGAVIQKLPSGGVLINEPYENSAAVKFGLEPGDVIIEIDGTDTAPLEAAACSEKMRGIAGTELRLKVVKGRTGDTVEVNLIRDRIHVNDVVYYGMLDDVTGYISIGGFTQDGSQDVKKAVVELKEKGAERLVLDLRNNGGGLMSEAIEIVSLFVPEGTLVVYSKGKHPESFSEYRTKSAPVDTEIPLLVMVNSGSASSSEIVTGALQDLDRATVAGTRTYGKGLVQSIRSLGYNTTMKLTTAKYYIPSGRCVQAIDYSNRNQDGSVGAVPDSLKKAFRTAGGRTVYDGGGIDPDLKVDPVFYSRPIVALIYSNIVSDFAIEYYKKHPEVSSPTSIRLSDREYDEFVKFAATREFDNRTESQIKMEGLLKMAEAEQLTENIEGLQTMLDQLSEKMSLSKEEFLNTNKDLIRPFIEDDIASKYFFRRGGLESALRNDAQLKKSITLWKSDEPVAPEK